MIWLVEMLRDYTLQLFEEKTQKELRDILKENRLLYELGEISLEEYEKRNKEITQKLKKVERITKYDLIQRINILGDY